MKDMLDQQTNNHQSFQKTLSQAGDPGIEPGSAPCLRNPVALFERNIYNIAMEKRRFKRAAVYLKAERISGNEKYGVFIENISEKGIHMLATHAVAHAHYSTGKNIRVSFHIAQRKPLILRCRIRWSCPKAPSNGLTDSIGLEILDPPPQYIEFVRTLN